MSVPDDDERTTSVGLYHYAESYRDCADFLFANRPQDLIFEAPIDFLYWHAMELYFKSFLRSDGISIKILRTAYGHRVDKLYTEATTRGLRLSQFPDAFFDFVDPNEPLEARYISTGFKSGSPSTQALKLVAAEIRGVVAGALQSRGENIRWW